jgi:hypothetical protein
MSLPAFEFARVEEGYVAELGQFLVLRRGRSQWTEKTLGPADTAETKLLPGFKLPCAAAFEAGGEE